LSDSNSDQRVKRGGTGAEIRYSLHLLRQNPLVVVGLAISLASILLALSADFLIGSNTWQITSLGSRLCWNNPVFNWGISNVYNCGGSVHLLGTDSYGRDLFRMIILAIPLDLQIALEVVFSAVVIGVVLGATAAYSGGIID